MLTDGFEEVSISDSVPSEGVELICKRYVEVSAYDSIEELAIAIQDLSDKYSSSSSSSLEDHDTGNEEPSSCSEVARVVNAIPLFIAGDAEKQKALGSISGFLNNIVSLLERFLVNDKVAASCCNAIKILSRYNVDISTECLDNVNILGDIGACELVVRALEVHMELPEVVESACWAIRNLVTIDPENNLKLVKAGASALAVEALSRYGTTLPTVSEAACGAVSNVAYEEVGRKEVVALGASKHIASAMRAFAVTEAGIARQAASAIRNLTFGDDDSTKLLSQEGVCEVLVTVLKNHCTGNDPSRCVMAELVCRAISNMSTDAAMTQQWGNIGAVEALLSVVRDHMHWPGGAEALHQAILALSNLATEASNIPRLIAGGACELVIEALNKWGGTCEELAEEGCGFIVAIAYEEVGRSRIVSAGACEAVVAIMREYGVTNSAVSTQACSAVWNLAFGDDADRHRLEAAGACEMITKILAAHGTNNSNVVTQASGAACNLAATTSSSCNNRFLAAGICRPIIEILKIKNVSGRQQRIGAVVSSIAQLITSICYDCNETSRSLGAVGVCEVLLDILKAHISSDNGNDGEEAATQVCIAIRSLSSYPANRSKMKAYGAPSIMSAIKDSVAMKEATKEAAVDALSILLQEG